MQLDAHFTLAFATAPRLRRLTLLHTATRRLMQKARGHTLRFWPLGPWALGLRLPPRIRITIVLPLLVGTWFQILFHSPPGVLFTFQSPYYSTIGR